MSDLHLTMILGHEGQGEVGGYLVQCVSVVWKLEGLRHSVHKFLITIVVFCSGNRMVVEMPMGM